QLPIKTLLLGNSGAGKTTFAYRLEKGTFKNDIHSTHGMRFFQIRFPEAQLKSKNTADVEMDIWDFGGQPEYQLAHQQNYDNARLVFLCVDLSRPESDDRTNSFWIDRIKEHKDKMSPPKKVFVIGTKQGLKKHPGKQTTDQEASKRLNALKMKLAEIPIDVDCIKVDVKNDEESQEFIKRLELFIQKEVELEGTDVFSQGTVDLMRHITALNSEKGYIHAEPETLRSESDLPFSNEEFKVALKFMEHTGKVELLSPNESMRNADHPLPLPTDREEDENRVDEPPTTPPNSIVLLRCYWKNIAATALLRAAKTNPTISGALAEHTVYTLDVGVVFDKQFEDEINNDEELFKQAKKDTIFKKPFVRHIVERLLKDGITYRKMGMFVFPSRFPDESKTMPDMLAHHIEENYKKLDDIKLLCKNNPEETITVIITNIHYSEAFSIEKHLFKGVLLRDANEAGYFLLFDRRDEDKEKDKDIQPSVTISIYEEQTATKGSVLLQLLQTIMEKHLLPLYTLSRFSITTGNVAPLSEENNAHGALQLEVSREKEEKIKAELRKCFSKEFQLTPVRTPVAPEPQLLHPVTDKI
ncbi:MAG: hypothetical protein GY765_22995, partial [bacterium]|nr:hypothetical protein [bacterium]